MNSGSVTQEPGAHEEDAGKGAVAGAQSASPLSSKRRVSAGRSSNGAAALGAAALGAAALGVDLGAGSRSMSPVAMRPKLRVLQLRAKSARPNSA